jgi:wyosine [tRNA(Phe)-imidazoG37] synthetase (radical SAM superfamily)
MDDWKLAKFVSINEINKKLDSAKKYADEVTFSSLEPTFHPKLNEIAKLAKEK